MRRNFLCQKNLFLAVKIIENKEFLSNFCGSKFCQDMPPQKKITACNSDKMQLPECYCIGGKFTFLFYCIQPPRDEILKTFFVLGSCSD
jgi:hypothetical protein